MSELNKFIAECRERLDACKSDLVLGNATSREDLKLLLEIVERHSVALEKYRPYCVIVTKECAYSEQFDEFTEVWMARDTIQDIDALIKKHRGG